VEPTKAVEVTNPQTATLKRSLGLWDLILYGVIVIQPVAPMSVYGVLSEKGHGHVVTAILIAMVAMLFTGISYGRMARAYPSAGSAFTYVAQEIHPSVGFITGWSMVMDYMLNPLICTIWCAGIAAGFTGGKIQPWIWKIVFAVIFTLLNIRGVKTSARVNAGLALVMGVVILLVLGAAWRFVFSHPHDGSGYFLRPFYDATTFSWKALFACTSVAVLTYIGFDGISTLSEEVDNPRRNILLATVYTCLAIGILSAIEVYVAQLIWPATTPFPNVDQAYVYVSAKAWAPLFAIVGGTLFVANFGSGMGAQLGAARLLYGMGRSNALPKKFFGAIDPHSHVPRNNVFFVGVIALIGAFALTYDLGAEMLNFGALIAFMGVNLAAFLRYYVRAEKKQFTHLVPPLVGFIICLGLWLNLSKPAKLWGGLWMLAGIIFGAIKTKGFRSELVTFDIPAEE
jgi:amino acid transporter